MAPAEPVADPQDPSDTVLAALAANAPDESAPPDTDADILADLAGIAPAASPDTDKTADILSDLAGAVPPTPADIDGTADVLSDLAGAVPPTPADTDDTADVLSDLAGAAPPTPADTDDTADVLSDLAEQAPQAPAASEADSEILADLVAKTPANTSDPEPVADILADLAIQDNSAPEPPDGVSDILSDLTDLTAAPEDTQAHDATSVTLTGLAATALEDAPKDDLDNILGDLALSPGETTPARDRTDDILSDLSTPETPETPDGDPDEILSGLGEAPPEEPSETDALDDILAGVDSPVGASDTGDDLDDILAGLDEAPTEAAAEVDELDDILAGLGEPPPEDPSGADGLDDILAGVDAPVETSDAGDDLDDILGGLDDATTAASTKADDLDDILAGLDDAPASAPAKADDLDDILAGLDEPPTEAHAQSDDLDDLLAGLSDSAAPDIADDGLDDLLADLDAPAGASDPAALSEDDGLDDLLADLDAAPAAAAEAPAQTVQTRETEFAFGTLTGAPLAQEALRRTRFRIALFGDFTGRAVRGVLETGAALASRAPVQLDPDTVENIIESFAQDLILPVGKDGAGVRVPVSGLDDLHPDEIYEKAEIFAELNGLRGQLQAGATSAGALDRVKAWSEAHDMPLAPTHVRSAATSVPADLKLSDFQRLIGDETARLSQASPVEDMIGRIVGPHLRRAPDADAVGLVDEAIATAMRLILHHPDFQALESQWRSLDLLARSIEADDTLDVMLYDISAEEIAADLAAQDDLSQSGLARLLTEAPLDEETGRGAYSLMVGLYTFEETPPHAQILGRIARVAAHVDAPFVSALSNGFMETAKDERHPLVAQAWDTLRAMPEAAYLGLAAPRFMLRRPYGAKTEPTYEFDFEEFTPEEGLKGLLWANPVVLVTILVAQSFRKNGPGLDLGSVMSLGDVPYHYVNDRFGDQVALPCTERNLTLARVEEVMARGLMPVVWVKGRDEIRLTSFNALGGETLRGPWTGTPVPPASPPKPPAPAAAPDTDDPLGDLDDLLADFANDTPDASDEDAEMDPELAALLEGL
ncbi:MAG: type VI secretion system contractile sheath large subunit [Pseudomonadota bacterium]